MAENKRGQVVVAPLTSGQGKFAIITSNDVGGGRFIVNNIDERNSIPDYLRKTGMLCYVLSDNKEYRLMPGAATTGPTVSANWKEVAVTFADGSGSSSGGSGGGGGSAVAQKVEDIEFNDPVAAGATKLMEYLNKLKTDMSKKLDSHQKAEDARFNNTTKYGFSTLGGYLDDLDTRVRAAGAAKFIEDLSWRTTPDGHQSTLEAELKSLALPKNIKLPTGTPGGTISLEDKIKELEQKVPKAEQITNASGTGILQLISDASDPNKIKTDGTKTLTQTLTELETRIDTAAVRQKVEDIEYQNATPAGHTKLTQTLALINDPNKIIVDAATQKTLTDKLQELSIATGNATQNIEDINWNNVPSTDYPEFTSGLADTLKALYNKTKDVATKVDNGNINITVEKINWGSTPAGHQTALSDELAAIRTEAKTLKDKVDTVAGTVKIDALAWNSKPAGDEYKDTLGEQITSIVDKLKEANKPDKIMLGSDKLEDVISNLKTAIAAAVPPQHLMFNLNNPEVGPVTTCEYLTTYKSKINEIAVYTNADATLSSNISIALEFCGAADSAYQTLAQTTINLPPSQAGKLVRINMESATTPVLLEDNTRLRVNIKAVGATDTINTISVRATLVKNEDTGNRNVAG